VGDSADGIPGVPGFREKSASAVLGRYGHLEAIPDEVARWDVPVRGAAALAASLAAHREAAGLYRTLATVRVDVPLAEDLEEINRAAQRARALTSQLLGFSRRQVRNPVVFDLNTRVRDIARLLERIIGEDIKMTLDLSPAPAPVSADPSSIDQVVMNLIVNARDAMPKAARWSSARGGRCSETESSPPPRR
jgi:signal transduction histidine kinase